LIFRNYAGTSARLLRAAAAVGGAAAKPMPANRREHRRDRRYAANQSAKRRVVVIVRDRGGNSVPCRLRNGKPSRRVSLRGSRREQLSMREAASWDNLHERFEVKRINHQEEAYSLDGASTNWAEEYFSRLWRAEIGIHHHIAGAYLLRYAQESSWREDNRRVSNGDQVNRIAAGRVLINARRLDEFRAGTLPYLGCWKAMQLLRRKLL
jgi:hypothetical protein